LFLFTEVNRALINLYITIRSRRFINESQGVARIFPRLPRHRRL